MTTRFCVGDCMADSSGWDELDVAQRRIPIEP
jgi:hypothetical protein